MRRREAIIREVGMNIMKQHTKGEICILYGIPNSDHCKAATAATN